jgi:hypothetical protein
MIDYYASIRTLIGFGGYTLESMEDRIERLWVEGKLTTEQRDELRTLAAESAKDADQVDVVARLAELERRVYDLEHPTDIYPVWTQGYITKKGEIVRFDVSGDGVLDLCQYNGGRNETSLSIGKIEGWNMLDRELTPTHTITRDADGGYVLTPINAEQPTDGE